MTTETMICSACGDEKKKQKGGVCQACVLRNFRPEKKYRFTPDLDAMLRRAYRAKNKTECTRRIDELVRRTGWPRHVFNNRAHRMNLSVMRARKWDQWELDLLRERAGELTATKLAWLLKRTVPSVKQMLFRLDISGRVTEGFSRIELSKLMGVRHELIELWLRNRWLSVDQANRISYDSTRRFLLHHMDEYRFGSCDEFWLKTMLRPSLGSLDQQLVEEKKRQGRAA